jgi:methionyl aminopeptidase
MIARTQEDIDILREGGKRLARHMRELCKMVKPGVAAADLEKAALAMIAADGDKPAFLHYRPSKYDTPYAAALCISINDAIVHGLAGVSDYVIQDGDVVSLDCGIQHRGLFTDHAATVIAGTARPEDAALVRSTNEALAAGIAAARVGNTTGDIGYAVEQVAKKYFFGYPKNLAGHGVGMAVHEEPMIPNFGSPRTGSRLVEGQVIALEPMMTLGTGQVFVDKDGWTYRTKDGSRTAHAEHTVLVTKDGPEIITK